MATEQIENNASDKPSPKTTKESTKENAQETVQEAVQENSQSSEANQPPETHNQPQAIPVMVVEIAPAAAHTKATFPGRVSAYRRAEVRAQITGIVKTRDFIEGSAVAAGDTLFTIEDESLSAILRAREADVEQAKASYELSQQTIKRYQELLKMGAVSRQEFDQFSAQNKQAKAALAQASANRDLAKINLGYATVVAPIAGRIDQALVTEGALVNANTTQLATIEQIDKVNVDFTQSKGDPSHLQSQFQRDNITVNIVDASGKIIAENGELQFASQRVDEATGSVRLRAVFENPDKVLLPNMFVRVQISQALDEKVIKLPQSAVAIGPNGPFVYQIENQQLKQTPVVLGEMDEASFIIESGLATGARVAIQDVTGALRSQMPVMGLTAEEFAQMQASAAPPSEPTNQPPSQGENSLEPANTDESN